MPVTKNQEGFTTLEAAISLTVLAVALLSLWGTLVYCSRSDLAAEQKKKALNAAQSKIEELKARPFETLITEFGPNGTVGDRFAVTAIDQEAEMASGRVVFFVNETEAVGEDLIALPLDLNGDGDTEDADVSAGFELLPVKVTIQWEGPLGSQRLALRTLLRKED